MADPTTLRELAQEMYGHADAVLRDCERRLHICGCTLIADVYRELAGDFHQRAHAAEGKVRR